MNLDARNIIDIIVNGINRGVLHWSEIVPAWYVERPNLNDSKTRQCLEMKARDCAFNIQNTDSIRLIRDKELYNDKEYFQLQFVDKVTTYVLSRLMIQELKEVFGIHISDRVSTIKRIEDAIDLNRSQILIRTDVKSFFENIGYERLSSILEQSEQISERSKNIYTAIFNGFYNQREKDASEVRKGLPRGLAVSSYLAELYLQDIDDKVSSMPEVKLYARYVDDIVILLDEDVNKDKAYEVFESVSGLFSDNGLQLHSLGDGKSSIHIYEPRTLHAVGIEYLGYSIILDPERPELKIGLTDKKIEIKTVMIDLAFRRFERLSRKDVKKARKDLMDCLNYLSANYALRKSKEGLRCGIYYSNELLTDLSKLDRLTEYLHRKEIRPYERSFSSPQDLDKYVRGIKEKISAIDFRNNWATKKMVSFTPERIGHLKAMMRQE